MMPTKMLDRARTILAAFDRERRSIPSPGATLEHASPVVREIGTAGSWAAIVYSDFDLADAASVIEREIAHFSARGSDFEWKVFAHDRPTNLHEILARHGFLVGEVEETLVLDLAQCPPGLLEPPPGVDVRRVTSLDLLADARTVWEVVFEMSFAFTADEIADALDRGDDRTAAFVAYADGAPVSAGRCTFADGSEFGGLWAGATLPAHRGRGYYRAVVAARVAEAARRGRRYLTTDARATSRPILLRQGFMPLTSTWPCEWKPAASSSR
jgi:GNAT superfamily N-acetyltransferase